MTPEEKLDSLAQRILEAVERAAEARRLEAEMLERESMGKPGPRSPERRMP
jgi:hypothetical protein